jgi:hypothetical protein
MDQIIVIEGQALSVLLEDLGVKDPSIYKVSVASDDGHVKTKVNEAMWTRGVKS